MARAMKDSGIEWIGQIPKNWDIRKNKYLLADLYSGGTPTASSEEFYSEQGVPFVSIGDMSGQENVKNTKKCLTEQGISDKNLRILPEGTVLYSIYATVGAVAELKISATISQAILALVLKECIDKNYYKYNLKSMRDYIFLEANGNTQFNLNAEKVRNFVFAYPNIDEQQKIANFLDSKCASIDAVIEKTKASIEEYKKLKQAIITQAVTKGIRPNRKMKDSGIEWIGEIPEEWKICKVRHIGLLQNGISKGAEFFGEGYPFVSYGDVYKNMKLPEIPSGLAQTTDVERNLYSVKKGDVFFTRTSETIEEVGFSSVCFNDIENATFAGFLIRLRPYDEMLDLNYSAYYFRSSHHRFYLVKEMNLVTRASLGQPLLKGMIVLVPGKDEQIEISDYLDIKCGKIDSLILNREDEIQKLELYKKSLIYEYVTGKKEVSV